MQRLWSIVVLVLVPALAYGQELFAPTEAGLTVGQKVRVVVDVSCPTETCAAAAVSGKIAKLSPESLVVDDGRMRHEFAALDVQRVERPKDRIWNGTLTGFGVGFGAGFVAAMADSCEAGQWCIFDGPSFAAAVGLFTGAIGAGIGALTDALISNPRLVFDRQRGSAKTTIMPQLGPRGGGLTLSVQF
jgi:hypothetical protein